MMGFTLNVTFHGLCAFIPSEPLSFEGDQVISSMRILVLDARKRRRIDSISLCAHQPQVVFDRPKGPDKTWSLAGERIELLYDRSPEQMGLGIRTSFESVASLKSAAAPGSELNPELLERPEGGGHVVADLTLETGEVYGVEQSLRVLEFRTSPKIPGTYRGRFARAVQLLIPVTGDTALLRATPYQGGEPREAELAPKRGRSAVDVTFSNLCASSENEKRTTVDADFRLYYFLLRDYGGPFPLPTLLKKAAPQKAGEVRGEATSDRGCIPSRG
jgi:hypothetical protein